MGLYLALLHGRTPVALISTGYKKLILSMITFLEHKDKVDLKFKGILLKVLKQVVILFVCC